MKILRIPSVFFRNFGYLSYKAFNLVVFSFGLILLTAESLNAENTSSSIGKIRSSVIMEITPPTGPGEPGEPTITGAATTSPFITTYGTAASAQTFSVSGVNLTANLLATAPTGFEMAIDGATYGATAIFTQTNGSASGTLSVRLKSNSAVSGSYNSQNIILSSAGAASVNITTAGSGNNVTAKGLTISGLTGSNKPYDGGTTATFTGTAAYSGLVNSV